MMAISVRAFSLTFLMVKLIQSISKKIWVEISFWGRRDFFSKAICSNGKCPQNKCSKIGLLIIFSDGTCSNATCSLNVSFDKIAFACFNGYIYLTFGFSSVMLTSLDFMTLVLSMFVLLINILLISRQQQLFRHFYKHCSKLCKPHSSGNRWS